MITLRVESLEQTEALAHALAPLLRPGDVLCLDGELGAGKTAFVKALAGWFGVGDEINSPTFTLENRHPLPARGDGTPPRLLVHCDLYRPGEDARRDLLPSMLEARDEGALLAVEWADPVRDWLTPYLQISVRLHAGDGLVARDFTLNAVPEGWPPMAALVGAWSSIGEVVE
jgi:tRNA threonylcarbamoyladenosine biosynthesis protein TsaE